MAHADHWQGCERRLKNLRADLRRREAVSRRVPAGEVQGTVVIDGETMSVDEELSPQQRQHDYDFSGLQGLQVVGSAAGAGGDEGPENSLWREALRSELEARAARFRQAVDASIVLANDGVIRWLGDPIAKLATGPDLLSPRAVILADTSLPEAAREAVAARLELWLAATTRRLLGPLLALRSLEDEVRAGSRLGRKNLRVARRIRTRTDEKPNQSARPEFASRVEKARRQIWGLLRLRSHRAQTGLESFGAAVVESPDAASGCRRACEGAHPDGVVRTNFAGCRSADFNRKLSRCGLPVMRRARCAG